MTRKLFAFDIDGTLLDSNKQALQSTREALVALRQAGHLVTIATGRSRFHAREIIRDLEFDNYILCNGAAAFLNHQQVYRNLLNREELDRFIAHTNTLGIDTAFISMDDIKRFTSNNIERMDDAMRSFGAQLPTINPLFLEEQDVYQALAFYDRSYEGQFDLDYPSLSFVRWHENCVDVVPKGGSKAATILSVAETVGIARENVIAFGDGQNDREMLREVGLGVAMGNATPDIQAEANFVTDTNDNDGIFKALKILELL
ncbi:MAG: Cof-type HAD-IIB family hydrolase [Enterococcus sp.]